ncbi:hypothetical protein [Lysinibacillus antri]|nr:hypothetical protein [Lysinibacillus antri]
MLVEKDGKVIEATEKAYEVVYKNHGYKPYTKPKSTRKKQVGGEDESE